jgi:hypothetical protein
MCPRNKVSFRHIILNALHKGNITTTITTTTTTATANNNNNNVLALRNLSYF